jgi:hypothetical protein
MRRSLRSDVDATISASTELIRDDTNHVRTAFQKISSATQRMIFGRSRRQHINRKL